ncbi:MAG: transposase [Tetrasphaera sp.]
MSFMSTSRGNFSPEFREQMVELYLSVKGRQNLSQVARENGIGAETLRNWVKKHQEANPTDEAPLTISERARLEQLEREVQELRLEREFLGKGVPRTLEVAMCR